MGFCAGERSVAEDAEGAERLGWRLATQAYTFNRFTFFEAIEKTKGLGLKYIEAYPGQRLSEEHGKAIFNHDASPEIWDAAKAKLKEAGLTLANYGVMGLTNDEAANRKVFDFAKAMGIETIVSEPPPEALALVDKLCQEYGINVAIHNHPKPSYYWNPETVVRACEGLSKRIGSCADTGHWMRSGVDPMDALKILEGRIVSLHFKELNAQGPKAHDVPWGTGAGDVKGWLAELKRQDVEAVFSIEYEHNWLDSVPEIEKCVEHFIEVSSELAEK
jgi:sugar phosphate isomerase/epimerase